MNLYLIGYRCTGKTSVGKYLAGVINRPFIDADVKIIITSGYTEDYRIRELINQGCDGFIQKPFNLMALSEKIMRVLNN